MSSGIRQFLESIDLLQHAAAFESNDIDVDLLGEVDDKVLKDMGIANAVHRLRILRAIKRPSAPSNATSGAASALEARGNQQFPSAADAERRQLTVMFCDLVGFPDLAEQLDPEELRDLMQAYQHACGDIVARYEGHVAQYRGDGLVVYFGWPRAHEDDAARTIRAALEMVDAVSQLEAAVPIRVRVGIHTGLVVVGQTGNGDASIPGGAVGDTPNIAAHLQALAIPGSVVVSEHTHALALGVFDYTDLGAQSLKGVSEPIQVFRATAARAVESRFDASRSEVALTPLVGREEKIALLLGRWQQAREGQGQVVLVGGEPGIGKSRLTRVPRERLGQERYVVLRYQCSPYHVNSALYPAIEHLEFMAGFTREDTPEQKLDKMEAALVGGPEQRAEAAPLVAALLSLPTERYPPLNLTPQKQKEKTLEVLAGQLEALSRRQPVLMVFEDAHWIDPTTQKALDALVPRVATLPILLAIIHRPEYTPHWAEQAHVTMLGLRPLGRRQVAELVAKVARNRVLPAEVLEQIVAHTEGVPLFVEELTKSVLESELLREVGDQYVLQSSVPALAIPASLRESLLARLDRLAPVKGIIQIGACIGRAFSYQLLARISALPSEQLEEALRKLTEAGLVYRRGTPPHATYIFKHALVQDAAYDTLLKSTRQQLHEQLAQALEQDFADRVANEPELLAHHYTQSGNPVMAIPWWRKAGELGVRRVALQEAVAHFQKGLSLIEQLPPSTERDNLELSIREPLNGAWIGWRGWPASEVDVNATAILKLAKNQGTPESLLMGLYGVWISTLTQGRVADALGWAERLLAEGNKAGDIDLQILGHTATMISHFYLGQLLAAREHGNRGDALYDPQRADRWMQLTGHDTRTVFLGWSAHWTWMLGYPDQAVQISDEKDVHARRLGHALNLGYALTVGAYPFDYRCEPEQLLERVREADRLAREQSIPILFQVMVPQVEGLARLRSRDLSKSIFLLRQGIENWNKLGGHTRVPYLKSALAEALALQGDLDAALEMIGECLEQIERAGWQERSHLAEVLRLKGWMLMRQGRSAEAETPLRASIDFAKKQRAKSWELRSSTTLAELLAQRGQRDAARDLLTPIYHWFTEGFDTRDLREAKALLDELS